MVILLEWGRSHNPMENRKWILAAAVLGGLSVAMGAFGSHGLSRFLSPEDLDIYRIAVRYQMWHTLAILVVVVVSEIYSIQLNRVLWAFLLGIVLFSGSLYTLVLTQKRWLGAVTPLGGVSFIVGWAFLFFEVWKTLKE